MLLFPSRVSPLAWELCRQRRLTLGLQWCLGVQLKSKSPAAWTLNPKSETLNPNPKADTKNNIQQS